MTVPTPTRRHVLTTIAGVGASLSLAGCASLDTGSLEPHVSESKLRNGGWTHVQRINHTAKETVTVAGISQSVQTHVLAEIYHNDRALETLGESTGIEPSTLPVLPEMFMASKAQIDPSILRVAFESDMAINQALDEAERFAIQELENQGLENIRHIEDQPIEIMAAGTATNRLYRADYLYDRQEFQIQGRTTILHSGTITMEAQLTIWPYEGLLTSTGGLYPGEAGDFELELGGRDHTYNLDLDPTQYRESIRSLTTTVS